MDFHLHNKQKCRKQNARRRQAKPKDKQSLGELPVPAVMQKQIDGTIPKRASHRKQEHQAQGDKKYGNNFAVHVQ
jgi:hypothetical protein